MNVDPHQRALCSAYGGKSVAVTGGLSFIGSHLVQLLEQAGASVTVVDDLSSGKVENLPDDRQRSIYIGDLRDAHFASRVLGAHETVFHLAAAHGGRGYIDTHPVECMNNMLLDHTVYAAAVAGGARRIVTASSACAYPTTLQSSVTERTLLAETDANFEVPGAAFADGEYGWAKLMSEQQLRAFHKQYGIDGIACRIFTAYGPRENESHAVIALIAKAMARLDPYPIWGDGTQTRNFTYVADTVMGMALAGAHLSGFDVINVGSPEHTSISEVIETIFEILGWWPSEIERQLDKPVGVLSRAADVSKCQQLMAWQPAVPVREGLRATIEWYAEHVDRRRLDDLDGVLMSR